MLQLVQRAVCDCTATVEPPLGGVSIAVRWRAFLARMNSQKLTPHNIPKLGDFPQLHGGGVSGFFCKCRKTRVITSVCGTSVLTVVKKVVP